MQFIASKKIVHRDLASRNILLTDSFNAKISDFGLSINMETENFSSKMLPKKLPIKWLSIEALSELSFTEKSDVWAFGVLMYEVFSYGKIPYRSMTSDDKILSFLKSGRRLERPEAADEEIYRIMLKCWEEELEDRPRFEHLTNWLHEILETTTVSYGYVRAKSDES
jgi:serine/threonine protein kinase